MRIVLAILFLAASVLAQDQTTDRTQAACGPDQVKFKVKRNNVRHSSAQPEAGKALLYFIQDNTDYGSFPKPTTRLGIDGNWAGANHGSSYFHIPIDPGEHHLCATWGSAVAVAGFTAEAGKTYYFRVRDFSILRNPYVDFRPVDSDSAQLLMSRFSFSTSSQKEPQSKQ
jgi:hypothetical protein